MERRQSHLNAKPGPGSYDPKQVPKSVYTDNKGKVKPSAEFNPAISRFRFNEEKQRAKTLAEIEAD